MFYWTNWFKNIENMQKYFPLLIIAFFLIIIDCIDLRAARKRLSVEIKYR